MAIKFFLGHKNGAWAFFKEKEVATWPVTGPLRSGVFFDQNPDGTSESNPAAVPMYGWTTIPDVNGTSGVVDVSSIRKAVIKVIPSHPYTRYDLSVFTACKIFPESARRWTRHAGIISPAVRLDRGVSLDNSIWEESFHIAGSAQGGQYYGGNSDPSLDTRDLTVAGGAKQRPMFIGPTTFLVDVHGVDLLTVSPDYVEQTGINFGAAPLLCTASVAEGSTRVRIESNLGAPIDFLELSGRGVAPRIGDYFGFGPGPFDGRKIVRITHDGVIVDRPFTTAKTDEPFSYRSIALKGDITWNGIDAIITGTSTKFLTEVSAGDVIGFSMVIGQSTLMLNLGKVSTVDNDLQLTLEAIPPAIGFPVTNFTYQVQRTLDIYVGLIEFEDSEI